MRLLVPILLAATLAGCAEPSAEDELRKVVERYVKATKTNDGETLCKLLTGRPLAEAQVSGACDLEPHGARGFARAIALEDVRISGNRAEASLVQGRSEASLGLVRREGFWFLERIELLRSELRVPDSALEPELARGESVIVDATAYRGAAAPRPGHLVAFEDPDPRVRRVARVAGGHVQLEGHPSIAIEEVIGRVVRP